MKLLSTVFSKYDRFKLKNSPQANLVYGFLTYILIGWGILSLPFLLFAFVTTLLNRIEFVPVEEERFSRTVTRSSSTGSSSGSAVSAS